MISAEIAAWIFVGAQALVAAFQFVLAAGAPWGSLAMGGRYPGRLPPAMRIAALVQIVIYAALAAIVLARAEVILPSMLEVSRWAVWFVVALMVVALVLNLITPSRWERRIWAPVALVLLISSTRVALAH